MSYITNTNGTWGFGKQPYANISTKKNRLKQYDGNVYLEDGQEFEIELFNPSKVEALAVIKLNGQNISQSGIIVRPGERIWLERYLDKNNRFKFETYQVGNSKEVQEAIENNGSVEVEFFSKKIYTYINPSTGNYYHDSGAGWRAGTWQNGLYNIGGIVNTGGSMNTGGMFDGTITTSDNLNFYSTASDAYLSFDNSVSNNIVTDQSYKERLTETGRIAEGSKSDQSFVEVNMEFESIPCSKTKIKILPISQKKIYSQDIKKQAAVAHYCTDCGTKFKATWKFCATCGKKI
jgi:hypothetical protein